MRLLMIRHPVTLANIQSMVQHEIEGDLAPQGYAQIEKLVYRLKHESFDYCYSSDAHRCRILAEAIARSKGISPIYNSLFREINNGAWNGSKKEDIKRLGLSDQINLRPEGGESLQDLADRTLQALDFIKSRGGERNILVSHGWFLKMFLGLQLGMNPIDSINRLKFSNCAISEIQLKEGGCLVEYLNNRDYLRR
ncbi:MAG: histidine phosphatase family protein [Nanoarchaeota archaeon]